MINSITNNPSLLGQLSPPTDLLTLEIKNELQERAQTKVNDAVATLEADKDQQWQLMLGQSYVDTQKSAVNAYTISAHGEALYETDSKVKQPSTLTDVYNEFLNEYLQAKYEKLPEVKPPIYNDEPVTIQPMSYEDNVKIQSYMSIQRPTDNSLLHLSA